MVPNCFKNELLVQIKPFCGWCVVSNDECRDEARSTIRRNNDVSLPISDIEEQWSSTANNLQVWFKKSNVRKVP